MTGYFLHRWSPPILTMMRIVTITLRNQTARSDGRVLVGAATLDVTSLTWQQPAPCTVPTVSTRRSNRPVLGWREWIALPDWEVPHLKAKVDTGARTSSLHAFDLEWFHEGGAPWIRFEVHPWQRSTYDSVVAEAPVVSTRDIKSSSGAVEHRPVVRTSIVLAGSPSTAEVTLTRRDEMGFRMLVGREAIRHRFSSIPASRTSADAHPRTSDR